MPETLELTSDTTHEQIEAYVSQVVKDVETDREGEKGDAQLIAEERDKPVTDTSAETDSRSEDTAEKGEDTDQAREWLDDDLRAEVAGYGIDEKELADFTSREEVDRALRFFDRSALEAGRKALAPEEKTEPPRDEKGRFSKEAGQYEISLSKDVYDEGLVGELERMRDHYESRLGLLESRFAEADATVKQQQFDAAVDAMGHTDLFGKTGSENPKELKRRQDLFQDCEALLHGIESQGREAGSYESLVLRVARMVFAEELGKKDLKARTRKMQVQSNKRMGGSATKAHESGEPLRDEMRRLYKELEGA